MIYNLKSNKQLTTNNIKMSNERMDTATDKIVDMFLRDEQRNCLEYIEGELLTNKKMFIDFVKEHIVYSIITMRFKGNLNRINNWLDQLWIENNDCDEDDEPEETEETEDEREVVIANYNVFECFKIPKGIDLKDKTQVKEYWVKYNTLHIVMVGQEDDEIEIESEDWIQNNDYKHPANIEIDSADNWGIDDEDDEDDEDEDDE
jgi:hypothetical protein